MKRLVEFRLVTCVGSTGSEISWDVVRSATCPWTCSCFTGGRRQGSAVEDFDIAPNKIGESGQRLADRAVEEARRREHAVVGNEHLLVAFAQSEWDLFAQVMRDFDLNPHAILHAAETELARQPRHRHPRPARVAGVEAGVQARPSPRDARGTSGAGIDRPVCRAVRGQPGRAGRDHAQGGHRARVAGLADHGPRPRHRARRRAAEEAVRAAAVPQALRDEPEPARAPGQAAAGFRPRPRDPADRRDPEPPRARQLGDAHRRARRRQDGDRRRPRAPHRVRGRDDPGPPARLPGRQPAVEQPGGRHHAARHVRGPHPERAPRAEGAAEPDPLHRRGAHAHRRRVGAGRTGRRGQRPEGRARPRRSPHHRRDDAERVQGVHPGRRGAGAALPHRVRGRAEHRRDAPDPAARAAAPGAQLRRQGGRRGDRDGAADVAALSAAPAAARQGDRLARHGVRARRDRPPSGSARERRGVGDLADGADSRGHGVPRRQRPVPRHRGQAGAAHHRPVRRRARGRRAARC